jgi:hypothetical protein
VGRGVRHIETAVTRLVDAPKEVLELVVAAHDTQPAHVAHELGHVDGAVATAVVIPPVDQLADLHVARTQPVAHAPVDAWEGFAMFEGLVRALVRGRQLRRRLQRCRRHA